MLYFVNDILILKVVKNLKFKINELVIFKIFL